MNEKNKEPVVKMMYGEETFITAIIEQAIDRYCLHWRR